jgi:hypothetical protein
VHGLTENSWIGMAGCACVAGDTKILNPITGESPTIEHLQRNKIAPIVMTLSGPVQAGIPFIKGQDDLYEVKLENGTKFTATAKHRVLASFSNANRFCHVSDLRIGQPLFSYAANRQQSTSGSCRSIRVSDVPDFQKTTEDFQDDYPKESRSCGEQLLRAKDTCQSFFPSQDDVQKHTRGFHNSDGFWKVFGHNPCSSSFRLSNLGFEIRRSFSDISSAPHSNPKKHEHDGNLCVLSSQSHSGNNCLSPSESPISCFCHTPNFPVAENCKPFGSVSCEYMVVQSKIVSIRKTVNSIFYDITVPEVHHYFAEGAIHHNSAGKTFNVVNFACTWWMMAPWLSSVILCSTTIKALKRRGWAEVQRFYTKLNPRYGNFVDSQLMWQNDKGDAKNAIIGIAVEDGQVMKIADNIKGHHTKRQMVIIDEATAIPPAIFEATTNLYSYPQTVPKLGEFLLVVLGNPRSRMDEMGKFCEPRGGWNSVDVDTDEWETKPQLDGKPGIVLRFDSEKSPNIVSGKIVSRHLPTKERVEAARKRFGGENSPSFWSNERGFWPPEGLVKTVFTESALVKFGGFNKHQFTGRNFQIIGTFDPSFGGGDRPALRFAKLGEIVGGGWGIESQPAIIVPINAKSTNPVHFQLAEQVRRECETVTINGQTYSCPPENLAIDATGEGGGLCDIVQRTWSPNIIRVEFGGKASQNQVSLEDVRLACDVYVNKTTEMHFRSRDALNAGQLKGIDPETAVELCAREFYDDGNKIMVQSKSRDKGEKKSFKSKFGKSPDLGDSFVMLLEVAWRKGFHIMPIGESKNMMSDWEKTVATTQAVYATVDYSSEEPGYSD